MLTLDALDAGTFEAVGPAQLDALVALVETGIEAAHTIQEMEARAMREQAVAQALRSAAAPRASSLAAAPR